MASKKIGAAWIRKSKDGKMTHMSGVIDFLGEDIQIAIFKNDKKEKENQPDYNIVRSGDKEERRAVSEDDFMTIAGQSEPGEGIDVSQIDFGK